jgi:hypothetical protein
MNRLWGKRSTGAAPPDGRGAFRDLQLEAAPAPMLFLPHAQLDLRAMTIVVRPRTDPAGLAPQLRAIVRDMDPTMPPPSAQAVAENHAALAGGPRFNLSLLAAFAIIALVLAVTGSTRCSLSPSRKDGGRSRCVWRSARADRASHGSC